jgi:hypothetical protein
MTLATSLFTLRIAANGEMRQDCKQCSKSYVWKKGSGSGTLRQHYAASHPFALMKWQADSEQAAAATDDSSSVTSAAAATPAKRVASTDSSAESIVPRKKQRSLLDTFRSTTNADLGKMAATAFAVNRISFNVLSSPEFLSFLDAYRTATVPAPTRFALRDHTINEAASMRRTLLTRLRSSTALIGIALDGWTNVRHDKVTNIVLLSSGEAFYWCSIVNEREKNTAQWLHDAVLPHLVKIVQEGVRFAGFVADNEATMTALFNLLVVDFPFLIRIPCAAHTIQLIVKSSTECDRWMNVRKETDAIMKGFAQNKDARLQLRNLQEASKEPAVLNLIKPNDTRWNSFLYAAQRLLKLQKFVDIIFEQSAQYWSELDAFVQFLVPFQKATDIVQQDTTTLYDVFTQWNALTGHVSTMPAGEPKTKALSALRHRWGEQMNADATIACAIVSLEVKLDDIKPEAIEDARRFIITFGTEYLSFFKLTKVEKAEVSGRLLLQLAQFTARRERFHSMNNDITMTKAVAGVKWMALDVWALYEMELSVVAQALLALPSSEAAVERTFSAQDAIHTKKRNRLHDSSIEASMFIAFNHRSMTRASQPHEKPCPESATKELSLEFMDTDTEMELPESEDEKLDTEEEKKEDVKLNWREDVDVEMAGEGSEAAVAMRTQSEIDHDNRSFLEEFIAKHHITEWRGAYLLQLEAAALNHNVGGYSTKDLVLQIKSILRDNPPVVR